MSLGDLYVARGLLILSGDREGFVSCPLIKSEEIKMETKIKNRNYLIRRFDRLSELLPKKDFRLPRSHG